MPLAMRRARMRWPTSMSCDVVLLAVEFVVIADGIPLRPARPAHDPSVGCGGAD
jgi:hypothetical protein